MKTLSVNEALKRKEKDPAWWDSVLLDEDGEETAEAYIPVPQEICCDFVMRCSDDSATSTGVKRGDYVYICSQDAVENGECAAVVVAGAGDEAFLRKVYRERDYIMLSPLNGSLPPEIYRGEEVERVRILGKAVAVLSRIG